MLGRIDVDPASNAVAQRVVQATTWFNKKKDGLSQEWHGTVFLNPPYSAALVEKFTAKLVEELDAGRTTAAILLVDSSTSARWFQALLERFPVCFVEKRSSSTTRRAEGHRTATDRPSSTLAAMSPRSCGCSARWGS